MLGIYDVAKKQSLKKNGTLSVLFMATAFSTIFLSPFLSAGTLSQHQHLWFKALLVSASWISGLEALKTLPITLASPIKATRPVFVLLFSIMLFGERLNALQWTGSILAIVALFMMSRSGKKEGIDFIRNRGIGMMALSILTGVASALYDKHIMVSMEPLFVQSWSNLYITAVLGLIILGRRLVIGPPERPFVWDWTILLIAVFICIADAMYFFALKDEGALLSVISMIRRSSVIVTFCLGAALFKEHNLKSKSVDLLVILAAMAIIVIGSR